MKNKIKIQFKYQSNQFKSPQISIKCNSLDIDQIIADMTPTIEFDAAFGIHQFSLCLFNKELNDTKVDEENNIIDDLYVIIQDIKLDDISVIESINNISQYTNNQGDSVQTYGHLGFPTEFKIWLQVPGYMFKRNISLFNDRELMEYLQND